jgi:hypothetical protein
VGGVSARLIIDDVKAGRLINSAGDDASLVGASVVELVALRFDAALRRRTICADIAAPPILD